MIYIVVHTKSNKETKIYWVDEDKVIPALAVMEHAAKYVEEFHSSSVSEGDRIYIHKVDEKGTLMYRVRSLPSTNVHIFYLD